MKAGGEHVVPLSRPALELIKNLERFNGSPYLFPCLTGDSHLSNMAMGRHNITVHGFRSNFKDWAVINCRRHALENIVHGNPMLSRKPFPSYLE